MDDFLEEVIPGLECERWRKCPRGGKEWIFSSRYAVNKIPEDIRSTKYENINLDGILMAGVYHEDIDM
jgi:hypothetical protein